MKATLRDLEGTRQSRQQSFNHWSIRQDTAASNELELPVSSEFAVDRGFGLEILEHSTQAIDLTRFNDGALILYNHNPDKYLGAVVRAWVQGKKLWCRVKFDSNDFAQQIFRSIKDGIFKACSIGYEILEVDASGKGDDGYPIYRAVRWQPLELSFVTIPADPTVGVGKRSYQTLEVGMNQVQERDRVQALQVLGRQHDMGDAWLRGSISAGLSVEQARAQVLERITGQKQKPIGGSYQMSRLSRKERQEYSLCRAILATNDSRMSCLELDISQQLQRDLGKSTQGLLVPLGDLDDPRSYKRNFQTRATYQAGTATAGAEAVGLDIGDMIDFLRESLVLQDAGVRFISGLTNDLDMPKQTATSSHYWVGESQDVTRSESTFDAVSFRLKTVGARSRYSRQMLLQGQIGGGIETFVREDLAQTLATGIDEAIINGSGSSNQPLGIMNTAGVNSVVIGTNGGALSRSTILEMIRAVGSNNTPITETCFVSNANFLTSAMNVNIDAGSGRFLLEPMPSMAGEFMLNGFPYKNTNLVPSNLTKGTGTNLSALIYGRWSDLAIGLWGVLEILPNPYGDGYASGDVEVRALQSLDVGALRPSSFAICSDIDTTL